MVSREMTSDGLTVVSKNCRIFCRLTGCDRLNMDRFCLCALEVDVISREEDACKLKTRRVEDLKQRSDIVRKKIWSRN